MTLFVGSESPIWRREVEIVAQAIPSARIIVLEGHGHAADLLAPEVVADQLLPLLRE